MNGLDRRLIALYRCALRALPGRFRRRFGEEMANLFEVELGERQGLARGAYLGRAFVGLIRTAVLERTRPEGWGRRALSTWSRGLGLDVRLAWRAVGRRPMTSLAIVLTLVLGIGLNTAVFSLVNGLLLRPLPYGDPGRLVQLSETAQDLESIDVSLPDFHYWRTNTSAFSGMFAFDDHSFLLSTPDQPEILEGAVVSPGFLGVLAIQPELGRDFMAAEERPGRNGVAIISEALWERRFARDPSVLGQTLELSGRAYEIVGVAPSGFHFPEAAQVWIPLAFEATEADPEDYGYDVIARLAPGVTLEGAQAEGQRVVSELAAVSNGNKDGMGATAYPLRAADVPAALAGTVVLLLAAVFMVLMVACTNVASLLLARGEERRGDLAVRLALGAGVGRILRQHLVEMAMMASVGLVGALALAQIAVDWIPRLLPGALPFWLSFEVDLRVLGWSGLVAAVCCVAVAAPATLQARRVRGLAGGLSDRRVVAGRGRQWLVAGQMALAMVLVGTAGGALTGLAELSRTETGVETDQVLVTGAPIPRWSYPESGDRIELTRRSLEAVSSLPGVRSVAAADVVPLLSSGEEVALDTGLESATRAPVGLVNSVSPGYFETLEIPVLAGRIPSESEMWTDPSLALVSSSLAARMWPGEDAVGKRIRYGIPGSRSPRVSEDRPWLQVVGVVGDVSQEGPVRGARDQLYVTLAQQPPTHLTLMVRTSGDPMVLADAVRERIHELDAALPFYEPTSMAQARRFSVWTQRMMATLLTVFGALAGALALLGVYAVMAQTTRRRDREIGLRIAVGASGADVRRLILGQSVGMIVPGLGLGLMGATLGTLLLQRVVAGSAAMDPLALASAGGLLAVAALLAAWLPARRAAGIDPGKALSSD